MCRFSRKIGGENPHAVQISFDIVGFSSFLVTRVLLEFEFSRPLSLIDLVIIK